jgi:hypothetical protein
MLAAELETSVGMTASYQYNAAAKQLKETITKKYWSDSKKLFADKRKKCFQHAKRNTYKYGNGEMINVTGRKNVLIPVFAGFTSTLNTI